MQSRHPEITEVNFLEFKGLSNYRAKNRIDNRYLYYGRNVMFDQGKIKSSPGHDPYLEALSGAKNYRNLSKLKISSGGVTTEYLAALYNKEWYVINTETNSRTAIGAALSYDEDTDTGQYVNTLYTVSPNEGGGKITGGNTYAPVTDIPKGSMMEFAWEKMWIAGVPNFESTIYGSKTATAFAISNVENFTDNAQIELVGKGGAVTSIRFLLDTLYIFKSDSIHYIRPEVNGDEILYLPKPYSVTGGAVNHRSTIIVENDIWFLTPDLQIRKLGSEKNYLGDKRTNDISDIIKGIMDELDADQSSAVAHYHNKIFTLALRERNSPIPNIVINYNYDNGGFGIDRFPSVKQWATVNNKVFMALIETGQLYLDRMGYAFGADFDIPFEVRTPFIDFQSPDKNWRNRRIFLRGSRSANVPITLRLYQGDYDTYTDYIIPEPTPEEVNLVDEQSPYGSTQFGAKPFGGSTNKPSNLPAIYPFNKHISTSKISNMFALGIITQLKGQRIEIDQAKLGILPASRQVFNI